MMESPNNNKKIIITYINRAKKLRIYYKKKEDIVKIVEIDLKKYQYGWKLLFLLYSYSSLPDDDDDALKYINGRVETLNNSNNNLNNNKDVWLLSSEQFNYLFELLMGQLNGKSKTMVTKLWNNIMQLALK